MLVAHLHVDRARPTAANTRRSLGQRLAVVLDQMIEAVHHLLVAELEDARPPCACRVGRGDGARPLPRRTPDGTRPPARCRKIGKPQMMYVLPSGAGFSASSARVVNLTFFVGFIAAPCSPGQHMRPTRQRGPSSLS